MSTISPYLSKSGKKSSAVVRKVMLRTRSEYVSRISGGPDRPKRDISPEPKAARDGALEERRVDDSGSGGISGGGGNSGGGNSGGGDNSGGKQG
jgi:uncharacterized membrane protein YgcG